MLPAWYLRRAVPWAALLGLLVPAAVLAGLVGRWETLAGLGLPLAALLAAAAVAFVFDDTAAAVTTVTPRGARWARAARAVAAVGPLVVGAGLLVSAPAQVRGDRSDWVLVIAALGAVVVLAGTVGAVRQVPRPGAPIASAVLLAGMTPLVLGLFFDVRSPYPVPELTTTLRTWWASALGGGLVGVAVTLLASTGLGRASSWCKDRLHGRQQPTP